MYLIKGFKIPEIQDGKRTSQPFKCIGSVFHVLDIYLSLWTLRCKPYHLIKKKHNSIPILNKQLLFRCILSLKKLKLKFAQESDFFGRREVFKLIAIASICSLFWHF